MTIDSKALLALAERCEAATGADRELDAAIALAQCDKFFNAGPKHEGGRDRIGVIVGGDRCVPGNGAPDWLVPRYTASLDAALTLVPDDAFWRVGHDGEGADPSVFKATIGVAKEGVCWITFRSAIAETAPLALCAAALRARAAMEVAA